jgi:trigger factor
MTNNLERQINVSIPADSISEAVNNRIKKLKKTIKINGFRPGKVSEDEIKKRFGNNIENEILNEMMEKYMIEAVEKEKLHPAVYPNIKIDKPYQSGEAFQFTAVVEVFPEVTLLDFSELIIEKTTCHVSDEDISKTLEGMQKQHTTWKEIDRPAQELDRVWIKFTGSIDGKPFEGGSHDNMPVILGSNSMIPGFESGLLNTQKNQDTVIQVTFPENYGAKDLAGKPAEFALHINKIEAPLLPALNDEFAKKYSMEGQKEGETTLEKLREEVKKTLEKQTSLALRQKLKAEVLHKLYEAYKTLEIPTSLVKQESLHLLEQTKKQFEQQFKSSSKMPSFTPELFEDRAKERIILGLVIKEIIKHRDLKPQASKVRELIESIAERFDEPEKAIHYYYSDEKRLREMESLALEEQVVDYILNEATLVEKQAAVSDILGSQSIGG